MVANLEGNVTGNVTGNTSGTAATVTGAAQSNRSIIRYADYINC